MQRQPYGLASSQADFIQAVADFELQPLPFIEHRSIVQPEIVQTSEEHQQLARLPSYLVWKRQGELEAHIHWHVPIQPPTRHQLYLWKRGRRHVTDVPEVFEFDIEGTLFKTESTPRHQKQFDKVLRLLIQDLLDNVYERGNNVYEGETNQRGSNPATKFQFYNFDRQQR